MLDLTGRGVANARFSARPRSPPPRPEARKPARAEQADAGRPPRRAGFRAGDAGWGGAGCHDRGALVSEEHSRQGPFPSSCEGVQVAWVAPCLPGLLLMWVWEIPGAEFQKFLPFELMPRKPWGGRGPGGGPASPVHRGRRGDLVPGCAGRCRHPGPGRAGPVPTREWFVGREDRCTRLEVSFIDDVEGYGDRVGAAGQVADLADHEDGRRAVGEGLDEPSVSTRPGELADEFSRAGEADFEAVVDGLAADGDGKMGLGAIRLAEEDHGASIRKEVRREPGWRVRPRWSGPAGARSTACGRDRRCLRARARCHRAAGWTADASAR